MSNPYVALLQHADRGKWCVRMYCTTCGGTDFRVGLKVVSMGAHPDEWTRFLASDRRLTGARYELTDDEQVRLRTVLREADPFDIVQTGVWEECWSMTAHAIRREISDIDNWWCNRVRERLGKLQLALRPEQEIESAMSEIRLARLDSAWSALRAASAILKIDGEERRWKARS